MNFRTQPRQRLDRRRGTVEFVQLMLREIARRELLRTHALTRHRLELAREKFRHRRFAVAVLAEERDAVVGIETQRDIRQDRLARDVTDGDMFECQERRARFLRPRQPDRLHMFVERNVDRLHARQHLETALRLARFRRLVAEAVDEFLHVLARGFLLLRESLIERAACGACFHERVVIAAVERELAVLEVQDELGGRVQEVAVMANDQNRAAITALLLQRSRRRRLTHTKPGEAPS